MTADAWVPPLSGVPIQDLPLWNAAMTYMGTPLPMAATGNSLRLSPIAAPNLQGPVLIFKARNSIAIHVHLDSFPFQSLLGVDLDLEAVRALHPSFADAIYQGSGNALLQGLPAELTQDVAFNGLLSPDTVSDADGLVWFAAALDGLATEAVFFSVGVLPGDACALLKDRSFAPRSKFTGLKDILETTLHRILGKAVLPLADIKGIAVGDLLVFDPINLSELTLRIKTDVFFFDQTEEGWSCAAVDPLETIRKIPAMVNTPEGPEDSSPEVHETPVQPEIGALVSTVLTFECGETPVSLSTLETFQIGALVPLPESVTKDGLEITVRAGEQRIAVGELVQIDDRMAVRINRLLIQNS